MHASLELLIRAYSHMIESRSHYVSHRSLPSFPLPPSIFAKTLSLCLENLENYLFNCYDAIGLLLMIKVTIGFRLIMQRRRIAVLDSFFDRITMLLWPRSAAGSLHK